MDDPFYFQIFYASRIIAYGKALAERAKRAQGRHFFHAGA
jgi:hypothetical protein